MAYDYETNPGALNKRILLLREHVRIDDYGSPVSYWHPFKYVYASIEPLTGREYWQAQQAHDEATIKIIMRYSSDINGRLRVQYTTNTNTVEYEMKSPIINVQTNDSYLVLMCREFLAPESI